MKRAIPLVLLLSACQFLTPEATALRDFNPLQIAPDELRAGLVLSPGMRLAADGAQIVATASRRDTGDTLREAFVLTHADNDTLSRLSINPEDYDRYTEVQARILSWEDEAPRATSGSITVTAKFCEAEPGAAANARLSIWMAPGPDTSMVPIVENLPLSEYADDVLLPRDDPACAA